MSDLAQQLGQIIVWTTALGLLALGVHCVREGIREWREWRRLDQRIGRIAARQLRGSYYDETRR